jgi:hypothetical protein
LRAVDYRAARDKGKANWQWLKYCFAKTKPAGEASAGAGPRSHACREHRDLPRCLQSSRTRTGEMISPCSLQTDRRSRMQCQLQARAIEFLLGVPIRTYLAGEQSIRARRPVCLSDSYWLWSSCLGQALSLDRSAGKANHQQRDCVRVSRQ